MQTLRWILASLHLIGLGVGFGACWLRAVRLQALAKGTGSLQAVLNADNWYGVATLLWIATGLWRAFGGVEKGSDYYLNSTAFLVKMALFIVVFALEWVPMVAFIGWRIQLKKQRLPDTRKAGLFATLTYLELFVFLLMVFAATATARGLWY
ncbi:MAG: DUF2214 family protein [Chitinophagaceae bacterium]|nr:DUF2214 family protein [Chitinophagaceae bacterium]